MTKKLRDNDENTKKILSATMAAAMMSVIMLGCGAPKITPEESAKITFDVV